LASRTISLQVPGRVSPLDVAATNSILLVSTAEARARKISAKDEAMDGELSKALETFHRPMPSDSMLQFTVTEDGYKKIVEERGRCNRK
jgi:hypothetical protein